MTDKVARAQQSELLAVPKGKDNGTPWLLASGYQRLHNLQYGAQSRRIVVGPVVYLVTVELRVHALVVQVGTHDHILVGPSTGQYA